MFRRADSTNPIDAFIAAEVEGKGLQPAAPADKLTLLRRVYFDLTGCPPAAGAGRAFLQDESPDAYDKVVDRLLGIEQHGVRWARHWLDVLRYADLDGLDGSVMPAASGIYLWRDWVISALNHDMPYDQFVRAQILGSRYKEHTTHHRTGSPCREFRKPIRKTASHWVFWRGRRSRATTRSRISPSPRWKRFRRAFMGMTVGCAKCHDHKFDPIKQKDFYSMKALFDPLVLRKVALATPAEIFANGQKVESTREEESALDEAIEKLVAPYQNEALRRARGHADAGSSGHHPQA